VSTNPSIAIGLARQHHRELLVEAAQQRLTRPARAPSGGIREDSPTGQRARRRGLRAVTQLHAEPAQLASRTPAYPGHHPRTLARTRNKGATMSDPLTAHRSPPIKNPSTRARRYTIGGVMVTALLLTGVLGSTCQGAPQDSGLVACAYPLSTQDVPATDYPKVRAEFAGSRWPDLRNAGTAYVDLAIALRTARGTDGYQTVWFYQRLSATCAEHGQPLKGST